MRRDRKSFVRKSGVRDARLIIIAAEGELTEKQYFEGVAYSKEYRSSKVHVEVLDRGNTNSDPKQCLTMLNGFKKEYNLNKSDEMWLVCDVDRWGSKKLSEVNQLCKQKSYLFAVSNPCFESWLMLHYANMDDYSDEKIEKLTSGCKVVINELNNIKKGGYNKTKLNINEFLRHINNAVVQARNIDDPKSDWPNSFGSKIYMLMESIIKLQ